VDLNSDNEIDFEEFIQVAHLIPVDKDHPDTEFYLELTKPKDEV
jgi:hypothetical protein